MTVAAAHLVLSPGLFQIAKLGINSCALEGQQLFRPNQGFVRLVEHC